MTLLRKMIFEIIPACKTKEEAKSLVDDEAKRLRERNPDLSEEAARALVLKDVGYASGFFNRTEATRILEIFETKHPHFGAVEDWP